MSNFDGINKNNSRPQPPHIHTAVGIPQQVSLLKKQGKPHRILKTIIAVILAIVVIGGTLVVLKAANLTGKIFVGQKTSFFNKLKGLVAGSKAEPLAEDDNKQINILLLGIGGEGHDGPYLSDTIMLAQIKPESGEISLVSVPRDYLASLPDGLGELKINSAFALGFNKHKDWNEAGQWARQAVEKISGETIPYFAVVDFSGFEKAVDQVGGLDVHIDRTFTDYSYPDSGTGYLPPVTFKEGDEHMNGTRALEFARSRHAAGIEGSDFSRSKRQEKIITAFKQKVLGLNVFSDASKMNSLLSIFADHFHTNMSLAQLYQFFTIVKNKDTQGISSVSLDPSSHLICPEILATNGAYVLTPCPGKSESDLHNFFSSAFSLGKLASEQSIVWLANSTGNNQAYKTAYRKLTDAGLTVIQLPYSTDNLPQSLVYEVNPKPATSAFIIQSLNATSVAIPPPDVKIPSDKVDVIVILGANAPIEPDPKPYVAPPARKPTTTTSTIESILPVTSTSSTTATSTQ